MRRTGAICGSLLLPPSAGEIRPVYQLAGECCEGTGDEAGPCLRHNKPSRCKDTRRTSCLHGKPSIFVFYGNVEYMVSEKKSCLQAMPYIPAVPLFFPFLYFCSPYIEAKEPAP
jgi:hypothetical protein